MEATRESPPPSLNCTDRPRDLEIEIARNFARISRDPESRWGLFNGRKNYDIANLDAFKTIQHVIQTSLRAEYFAIDVGAGNFQWIHSMADRLNKEKWTRKVTIHIIGIRGEKVADETPVQKGICIVHELGNVRIEDIGKEFARRGFSLTSKVDFITSRWCMRHLADPVGTFLQLLQLLRVQGLIATDGFYYSFTKDLKPTFWDEKMVSLLLDIGWPFLYLYIKRNTDASHFVIQRPSNDPPVIRMAYKGLGHFDSEHDIGIGCYVIFHPIRTPFLIESLPKNTKKHLGKGDLFERLQAANLFTNEVSYEELKEPRPPTPILPPPPQPAPRATPPRATPPRLPPPFRIPPPYLPRAPVLVLLPPPRAPTLIPPPQPPQQPPPQGPRSTPEPKRRLLDDFT